MKASYKSNFIFILKTLLFICIIISCDSDEPDEPDEPVDSETFWAKTYCKSNYSLEANCIQQTLDGGYIVLGHENEHNAILVLKLNIDGVITWQKTYGGVEYDEAHFIQQTADGGYIVAGNTWSYSVEQTDFWIIKLNSDGSIAWEKSYNGQFHDIAKCIQQTTDGGYIVTGEAASAGFGEEKYFILKLNSEGSIAWQKSYGGIEGEYANYILLTTDGGYIVVGQTWSFSNGDRDIWILKLNSDGSISWQKSYGSAEREYGHSIQQTLDGGFIVVGLIENTSNWETDIWVLKLNSDGSILWQKKYSGVENVFGYSVRQTLDDGFVVVGRTSSSGRGSDVLVLKLNSNGSISWQKSYGGAESEDGKSIQQTTDGGFIVAGTTKSFTDESYIITNSRGSWIEHNKDIWILKLKSDGTCPPLDLVSYCTVFNTYVTPRNSQVTPENTSVTIRNTNCTITNTNVYVEQQAPVQK